MKKSVIEKIVFQVETARRDPLNQKFAAYNIIRIVRGACNEAYGKGYQHAYLDYHEGLDHEGRVKAVSEILNGPKKGKRK